MTYPESHDMTIRSKTSISRTLHLISKSGGYAHITKVPLTSMLTSAASLQKCTLSLTVCLSFSLISTSSCISTPEFFFAFATSHSILVMSGLDITYPVCHQAAYFSEDRNLQPGTNFKCLLQNMIPNMNLEPTVFNHFFGLSFHKFSKHLRTDHLLQARHLVFQRSVLFSDASQSKLALSLL